MVECSPEFSQYLSQNFPNTFVAAIFAGEIGVKSVASEQALGICTFWQSGLPDYTCSEWIISFIEALLKYGVIVDAECHLHACQNFLIWILLKSCTHMTLWSCLWEFAEWPSRLHLQFTCEWIIAEIPGYWSIAKIWGRRHFHCRCSLSFPISMFARIF